MFNEGFLVGIIPDQMKLAQVTKIYKGKSKLEVYDYRSISTLAIISSAKYLRS